ncbi:MAG: hypothetical protein GX202_08245 [Firmicutes bacterium]|nr:hypothetical protein [Bacillota bacterium]
MVAQRKWEKRKSWKGVDERKWFGECLISGYKLIQTGSLEWGENDLAGPEVLRDAGFAKFVYKNIKG